MVRLPVFGVKACVAVSTDLLEEIIFDAALADVPTGLGAPAIGNVPLALSWPPAPENEPVGSPVCGL